MKRFLILFVLLLSACAPLGAPRILAAEPTAFIAPSYPTIEAQALSPNQTAGGIEVRAERAWRDGKQVNTDVCFTLLDSSDWSIYGAALKYGDAVVSDFSTTLLSIQEPANGQNGLRCDTLSFINVPPDADLSAMTITVDSIAAQPRADEYCTIYMPKIQQAFNDRGIAITLGCTDVNGVMTMQIVGKPDSMSQEDAEKLVYSDEFYTVRGPWVFTFNLGQ